MRIPKTSRRPVGPLEEIVLGRGDYVAGGAQSLPFLQMDGARRRRPLVFGEVTDDLGSYPSVASEMFSGRQTDPSEWSVMWKEIGADGILLDLRHGSADLVRRISERTRMPIAVRANRDVLDRLDDVDDTVMILIDGAASEHHAITATGGSADEISCRSSELEAGGARRILILVSGFAIGDGLSEDVRLTEELRSRALGGESALRHPIVADVTGCWNRGFSDAREASMWEAESALAAMLAGADIIFVRGPGAADMARVYGEELADL